MSGRLRLRGMGGWMVMVKSYRISLEGGKNVLKVIMGMDIQLCEYAESHWCVL